MDKFSNLNRPHTPHKISVLLLLTVMLCCVFPMKAQLDSTPNRHIVVLIDVDPVITYKYFLDDHSMLPSRLTDFLKENNLYHDGDYLTIANYSFNLANTQGRNFETFVTIPNNKGEKLNWFQSKSSRPFGGMTSNWASISHDQHINKQPLGAARGSMNSLRLFYALDKIGAPEPGQAANSLHILTVSEDLNQGNDNIQGEFRSLFNIESCDILPIAQRQLERDAERMSNDVKRKFSFLDEHQKILAQGFTTNGKTFPYKIVETRVIPARDPSIQNILHLPAIPELRRARGGYHLKIDLPEIDKLYTVEKLELTLETSAGTEVYTAEGDEVLDILIPFDEVGKRGPKATLRAWIRYNDGWYNSLVFNPYDPEYREGLTMEQELVVRDEPMIYGMMRVNDAFWLSALPDDYGTTVMIYTAIVTTLAVGVLLIIFMLLLKRLSAYSPSSKEITIRPVNNARKVKK